MKIQEFDCPSCGASVKIKKGQQMLSCPYCDSTIIVPETHAPAPEKQETGRTVITSFQPTITLDTAGTMRRSCRSTIISFALSMLIGVGVLVFFLTRSSDVKELLQDPVSAITGGSSVPVVLEFGGPGMGNGYFQDPDCICVDAEGNIYVAEYETGRIQIFDGNGNYMNQWTPGKDDEFYIRSMAVSSEGLLYLVYDGKINIHDAETGEFMGTLEHPDGWGFDDVEVCDDESVVAAWYCNSDDIVKFAPDGSVEFVLREAISTQSGDSELDTDIEVDGMGNIFAYGSFNESVFKFSPNGRFLDRFGSDGDHPGQFTSPSCFSIDHQGRLWVMDFGDLKIFDNDGTYLTSIDPGHSLEDMVIVNGYQLYGITYDETVIQLDLSGIAEDL
jgi:DNA-directed RNA polymerase subunit RPC12/RpoP